jgi:hypothetical protein
MGRDRIDDEPNPRWDEWANKPLSDAEKDRILKAVQSQGGGGSSSSSGCLMSLLVWLGLAVMVAGSYLLLGGWA